MSRRTDQERQNFERIALSIIVSCSTYKTSLPSWGLLYTTNAIESLNSVIRKAINNRRSFQATAPP